MSKPTEYERGVQDSWEEHALPYGDEKFQLGMAVGVAIVGMFETIRRNYLCPVGHWFPPSQDDGFLACGDECTSSCWNDR